MDTPISQKNKAEESNNQPKEKESLASIKKRLETGEDITTNSIEEVRARNLSQTRDAFQSPSDTVINVRQGKGVININTGMVRDAETKKNIPTDFFLKQRGFSSSNIAHKGGRL